MPGGSVVTTLTQKRAVFPAFSSREVTLHQLPKIGIHFIIHPKSLTATLMQDIITHEKFLISVLARLTECLHVGKPNLPENAASAKQCLVVSLTFVLLPPSDSFNTNI